MPTSANGNRNDSQAFVRKLTTFPYSCPLCDLSVNAGFTGWCPTVEMHLSEEALAKWREENGLQTVPGSDSGEPVIEQQRQSKNRDLTGIQNPGVSLLGIDNAMGKGGFG